MPRKKPEPHLIKGVTRAEWCKQIAKRKRTVTPERLEQLREVAKKGVAAQLAKNGALFGRVNKQHVAKLKREAAGIDLTQYRQAVDDYR